MNPFTLLLLSVAGWMNRNQQDVIAYLQEEICVLKEPLSKKPRSHDDQRRRPALNQSTRLVKPNTLRAWHRRLIAQKHDSSRTCKPGRPRIAEPIQDLILKLARENRARGYTRIQGALAKLHHEVGRSTIATVLQAAGLGLSPPRRKGLTWKGFLNAHWQVLAATDFFTAELWTPTGLIRHRVLFVIRLATREVQLAGLVPEPHAAWMQQVARNLTDRWDGFLRSSRYLIHDRTTPFTEQFRQTLRDADVETIRLPARSPNLNAYAGRFVRTIRQECLDRRVFFGEVSLRRAIEEFIRRYHKERNHQGLENRIIHPEFPVFPTEGGVRCRKRLGGPLRYYYRKAA